MVLSLKGQETLRLLQFQLLLLLFRHLFPVVCDNEWQLEWTWIELEKDGIVFSRFNSLPSKILKKVLW